MTHSKLSSNSQNNFVLNGSNEIVIASFLVPNIHALLLISYIGDMMILCGRSFSILADSEVIWA